MKRTVVSILALAMCLSLLTPIGTAYAKGSLIANNPGAEDAAPRAIVYETIDIPADGEFYKITDDFEMPAKSRVGFQGTWSPSYARVEFKLYAHSTGNGAYVILSSGREGGLNATAASVYSLYARSVDNVAIVGSVNISN
ncbi:hypothetical protein [Oscillibacter sp.]|jgi:hypothetical protein|uniref:hypothetical protein n=1 Tax=Oscillibacter sp. TaxID=1945593 RepID=UPI0026182B4A|nr:hypothetical protein [Oscillibacter sp.]